MQYPMIITQYTFPLRSIQILPVGIRTDIRASIDSVKEENHMVLDDDDKCGSSCSAQ